MRNLDRACAFLVRPEDILDTGKAYRHPIDQSTSVYPDG